MEKISKENTMKVEMAIFFDEIAKHLPDAPERDSLGDEVIANAFFAVYPKMREHIARAARAEGREAVARKNEQRWIKLGESNTDEHWSHDGHTYENIPKGIAEKIRVDVREEVTLKGVQDVVDMIHSWDKDMEENNGSVGAAWEELRDYYEQLLIVTKKRTT
jgi:hypothetical protein